MPVHSSIHRPEFSSNVYTGRMPRLSSVLHSRSWLLPALLAALLGGCGQTGPLFLRIQPEKLPMTRPLPPVRTQPVLVPVGGTLVAVVVSTTSPPIAATVMSPSGLTAYIPVPAGSTSVAPSAATHP